MAAIPILLYNAYGGERLLVPVSLKDGEGRLGFVKALIDTGAPNTMLFENVLEKFRRLKAVGFSPPKYSTLGGANFERKTIGNITICLRDDADNVIEIEHEGQVGVSYNPQVAKSNPLEMILGLDFLIAHHAVIDLKNPAKPVLVITE